MLLSLAFLCCLAAPETLPPAVAPSLLKHTAAEGNSAVLQAQAPVPPPKPFTKPSPGVLRQMLTPLQFAVTQQDDTEPPFRNDYWDNKRDGIYVDVVSGEPLFSSLDKFDSDTGWPSFTKPLEQANIVKFRDRKLATERIEVRSWFGDSHLGHVFRDGPPPTGLRYCINSAALRFVPVGNLEKEGYGRYKALFEKRKNHD